MHRRFITFSLLVCLAILVTLVMAGCGGGATSGSSGGYGTPAASPPSGAATAAGTTITEQGFAFSPSTATVKVGDTVTFTNGDSAPHNVTIDGQELGAQNQGESKTWKATKAGDFPYSCVIHPSMTGQITVQ